MSKTKKIITIVALALVACLVFITILLACLPKQQYDGVFASTNGAVRDVVVFKSGKVSSAYDKDSAEYNKIVELYKKGLKQNVLLSMFDGSLSFKAGIEAHTTNVELNSSVNTYVVFEYNEEQTLKWYGNEYHKSNGSNVTFNTIVVSVTNTSNTMQECNIYICTSRTDKVATPVYRITACAKQYDLYNYISTLPLFDIA